MAGSVSARAPTPYQPCAVRRGAKPKPVGRGERILGIPTVLDRLIQQAVAQVLELVFDPHFSENSYGCRPGRSAVQAARKAREYQYEGKCWVVDLDLEKFFDLVNHDILMQWPLFSGPHRLHHNFPASKFPLTALVSPVNYHPCGVC